MKTSTTVVHPDKRIEHVKKGSVVVQTEGAFRTDKPALSAEQERAAVERAVAEEAMKRGAGKAKRTPEKEEQERALQEILAGPPTFTDITDSVAYVRALREADKELDLAT